MITREIVEASTATENTDQGSEFDPLAGQKIAERIRTLMQERESVSAFARRVGVPLASLRQNLNGSVPGADRAAQIAKRTGVTLEWLVTGSGAERATLVQIQSQGVLDGEFSLIPRYDVQFSSGTGALVLAEDVLDHLAFKESWLRSLGINPKYAGLFTNRGDSNEPTIPDGAIMLLDLSIHRVQNGFFYGLRRGDDLIMKRVQVNMDGSVLLISDNAKYRPEVITPNVVPDLHVIGQLKWFGRSI